MSIASADAKARAQAMAEVERALHIARRIPMKVFVVHLGWPRTHKGFGDSNRDAARRSVEELFEIAEPLGVRLAVEVIPNELSRPGSLVHFVEEDLESAEIGICLDFGHAHLDGDLRRRHRNRVGASGVRSMCTTTTAAPTIISCRSRVRSTGRRR